jgi:hypothetical protein
LSTACCSPGCERPIAQDALFANLNKLASKYIDPRVIIFAPLQASPFILKPAEHLPIGFCVEYVSADVKSFI